MTYLTTLLPAEALLLTEGKACSVKHYLKCTFMDLLLRQVLKAVDYRTVNPNAGADEKVIGPGKNFYSYNPRPYEAVLLTLYDGAAGRYEQEFFYFTQLVKVAYQKAGSASRYRRIIYENSTTTGWYTQNFLQQLFGGFSLTAEGQQVRRELLLEIAAAEAVLQEYMVTAPEKAKDLLHRIKGNVFLMKNIDLAALNAIDKDLLAAMNKKDSPANDTAYAGGCSTSSGCSGCSAWDSYDDYSGSWDSSCSGDSVGDGGSDSGGDGGSGCGGCGGGD
jgi:hypothetical protein